MWLSDNATMKRHLVTMIIVVAACNRRSTGGVDTPAMRTACGSTGLTCDYATEICVQTPVRPAETYECRPVPSDCASTRSCACVAVALCTGSFNTCSDRSEPNTVACECPQCQ